VTDNIINGILLIGSIQGFIFGLVVLSSRKYRSLSTYFLITLILLISYNNLQYFLSATDVIVGKMLYETIYLPIGVLTPPIIYFYVTTFLEPKKKITKREKIMYLPFIFFMTIVLTYKILCLFDLDTPSIYETFLYLLQIHEVVSLLFIVTVLIVSTKRILLFKAKVKSVNQKHIKPAINWLLSIIIMLLIIMIIYGYFIVKLLTHTEGDNGSGFISFYTVWIASSFLIYVLGHIGIYKFALQQERKSIRQFIQAQNYDSVSEKLKHTHKNKLEHIFINQKRYLDHNLTLDNLAEELQLSKSHLSRIINNELDMSFSDYVNSLRVSEAKKLLLNTDFSNYTLVAIGLEAGFNSKTTFYNTFKKFTKQTPSQFRKNAMN
jgi:AraC-like DNA-binding protein